MPQANAGCRAFWCAYILVGHRSASAGATTDCALRGVESEPASSQLRHLKADSHRNSSIIAEIPHGGHLAFMPAHGAQGVKR
jgi:hypothetical protein